MRDYIIATAIDEPFTKIRAKSRKDALLKFLNINKSKDSWRALARKNKVVVALVRRRN